MKNSKKTILISIIIIVIISICALLAIAFARSAHKPQEENEDKNTDYQKEYEEMKENSIMYSDDSTLKELKEEYKITGTDEIYQIETESDGRKVINVKPSINYKVAFTGMIKNSKPEFTEIDSTFEKNHPTQNGIWIKQEDREKIENYLKNNEYLKSEYKINELGYLEINLSDNATELDKKIQNIIESDKQYIFCISSICYTVDPVTGEIVDNPYNELETYQTYEYFRDDNKLIIFVTENKQKKMTNQEIFQSIIDLIDIQK